MLKKIKLVNNNNYLMLMGEIIYDKDIEEYIKKGEIFICVDSDFDLGKDKVVEKDNDKNEDVENCDYSSDEEFSDNYDDEYDLYIYKEEEKIKEYIDIKKEINNIENVYILNVFKFNLEKFKMYLVSIIENEVLECVNKIIYFVKRKSDWLIKKMNGYKIKLKKNIVDIDFFYYVIDVIKKIYVFELNIDIVLNLIYEMLDIFEFYMNNFLKK